MMSTQRGNGGMVGIISAVAGAGAMAAGRALGYPFEASLWAAAGVFATCLVVGFAISVVISGMDQERGSR